jgi:hypothetical protein
MLPYPSEFEEVGNASINQLVNKICLSVSLPMVILIGYLMMISESTLL